MGLEPTTSVRRRAAAAPSRGAAPVALLLVTGPPAVGKSTTARHVVALAEQTGVSVGLVDRDELSADGLAITDRLVSLEWRLADLVAAGAQRLVLAWPVQDHSQLEDLRAVLPWADITVCRLRADAHILLDRITARETTFMAAHLQSLALDIGPRLEREAFEDIAASTDREPTPAQIAGRVVAHWQTLLATEPAPQPGP